MSRIGKIDQAVYNINYICKFQNENYRVAYLRQEELVSRYKLVAVKDKSIDSLYRYRRLEANEDEIDTTLIFDTVTVSNYNEKRGGTSLKEKFQFLISDRYKFKSRFFFLAL